MNGLISPQVLYSYLIRALVMLIVIPFHEAAHALVSWKLGDSTAKDAGRLSMNPMRHFDPLGALCMVVGGVGWAKPVGINPGRFKDPKRGMAISAAAGPTANFLLAFVSMILYKAVFYAFWGAAPGFVMDFLYYMVAMNISLGVFNLIPVPPFDGSRIALLFLPQRLYFKAMRYEKYIMAAVLLLVFFGVLNGPLSACVGAVWKLLLKMTGFVELAFGIG
ncbi:MAG: site-2 protease family protein [Oscillospiraceae bacterium]|nr:site-2 protease family protein [Oscillospiraceae bacterium]